MLISESEGLHAELQNLYNLLRSGKLYVLYWGYMWILLCIVIDIMEHRVEHYATLRYSFVMHQVSNFKFYSGNKLSNFSVNFPDRRCLVV